MKQIAPTIRMCVLVAFGWVWVLFVLNAQTGGQLYLVSGLATPKLVMTVPSVVYSVDTSRRIATPVAELVAPKDGSMFVQADHERRLIVIADSHNPPRLVVLAMDEPSKPRSNPVSNQGWFASFLFENPQGRLMEAFHIGPCCTQDRLIGVDLLAPDPNGDSQNLPWEGDRYVRREGVWPPGDDTRLEVFPRAGRLVLDPIRVRADLGIVLPASMKLERDEYWLLAVNNDEILVINRTKMPRKELVGEGGTTELFVYEKEPQRWSTVHFPGAASAVRGFGHWLALGHADIRRSVVADASNDWRNERDSPGSEHRHARLRSGSREQDGGNATVDGLFKASRNYYPGILYFYDVRSQKRYEIKTGEGDSEVLLIEGDTAYYRVNQNLYSAAIGASGLGDSKLILSDETVQLSHWAFIGPSTSR